MGWRAVAWTRSTPPLLPFVGCVGEGYGDSWVDVESSRKALVLNYSNDSYMVYKDVLVYYKVGDIYAEIATIEQARLQI